MPVRYKLSHLSSQPYMGPLNLSTSCCVRVPNEVIMIYGLDVPTYMPVIEPSIRLHFPELNLYPLAPSVSQK